MKNLEYKDIHSMILGMKRGDFKEIDLQIEVDNDGVFFGLTDDNGDLEGEINIIFGGNGYGDVQELYQELFPTANVDGV